MSKNKGLVVHKELLTEENYQQQREQNDFILMKDAAELLDVSMQTLNGICGLYEIEQHRLRTRFIMIKRAALVEYLNNHHYEGKSSPDEEALSPDEAVVFDYRGEPNEHLTIVEEKIDDIPELMSLSAFVEKLGFEKKDNKLRRMTRYCDVGLLRHYRINSTYKLSQEDIDYNITVLNKLQFAPDKRIPLKQRKKRATKAEMEQRARKA